MNGVLDGIERVIVEREDGEIIATITEDYVSNDNYIYYFGQSVDRYCMAYILSSYDYISSRHNRHHC